MFRQSPSQSAPSTLSGFAVSASGRPVVLVRRGGLLLAVVGLLVLPASVSAGSASLDPPTIVAVCTPAGAAGGCGGWFTTNVDVSFSWSIPAGETFWSESGCNAFSVASDTPGLSYSCTVTVASTNDPSTTISRTVSGSIKRDATPPTLGNVQVASGPGGVALRWTVSDDATLVEVTRSPGPGVAIYQGLADHFTDTTTKKRIKYDYTVTAFEPRVTSLRRPCR